MLCEEELIEKNNREIKIEFRIAKKYIHEFKQKSIRR